MIAHDITNRIQSALKKLNIKNTLDHEGDVLFETKAGKFYIENPSDDNDFFHLIFPSFYKVETNSQRNKALKACNLANAKLKFVKLYVYDDEVYASTESFQFDSSDFTKIIQRSIMAIEIGLKEFFDCLDKKND